MKHIFFIHSPITHVVALEVIRIKKLQDLDIIYFTHRGFQIRQPGINIVAFPYQWAPEPFRFQLNFIQSWNRIQRFDAFLNQLTSNTDFHVYLPHSGFRVLKLLISHQYCKGYSYIEEGLDSYNPIAHANIPPHNGKTHLLDRLFTRNRISDRLIFNYAYESVYGIYPESFPGFRNRIVLKDCGFDEVRITNKIGDKDDLLKFHCSHIIALDAISLYGAVKREVHLQAFAKMLHTLKEKKVERVFVKFHPAQVSADEYHLFLKVIQEYSAGLEIEVLDQAVYLEVICYACRDVTFYVNQSSVGLYAHKTGHQVYSWASYMMVLDQTYSANYYSSNPVLTAYVKLLEV